MALQHCIACSGVVVALQSNPYAASVTASTARIIGFAKCIATSVDAHGIHVKRRPYSINVGAHKPWRVLTSGTRISR
jgi:hypothetical protein